MGNFQTCKVTFDISLDKIRFKPRVPGTYRTEIKESWSRSGTVTVEDFPFVPFPGLHLGDWQIVNVCQVYYHGIEDGKPVFHANCEQVSDPMHYGAEDNPHENWPTIEAMEKAIIERTKMDWKFEDTPKEE